MCDQDFDITASQRVRHGNVEQSLIESPAPHDKAFYPRFTGPMAILKAGWRSQFDIG